MLNTYYIFVFRSIENERKGTYYILRNLCIISDGSFFQAYKNTQSFDVLLRVSCSIEVRIHANFQHTMRSIPIENMHLQKVHYVWFIQT